MLISPGQNIGIVLEAHVRQHLASIDGIDLAFDGGEDLLRAWRDGLTPDPDLTVSAWADKHRVLSSRGASEAGPWRDISDALPARDHGHAIVIASVSAGRVHERFTGRRDRRWRQLGRLWPPP